MKRFKHKLSLLEFGTIVCKDLYFTEDCALITVFVSKVRNSNHHSKGCVLLQVGTGRFRRSHKYHDKNVDRVWVADNGYMVTGSTGSKFVKIWKVTTA